MTGATGFVGQAVLDATVQQGIAVRALTRREQEHREGIEWIRGDLHDNAALLQLVDGSDAVLHIAGLVNAPDEAGFLKGNLAGTQNVLQAARDADVTRFVCVSSLSAREPGLSDYGRSKRLAEEAVQTSGLDWTIVRPPAVYGPRDTEMLDLYRAAKFGVIPMPPPGRASMIQVDDLARLLLAIAREGEHSLHRIFEPDDGADGGWAHADLARLIGKAMGKDVWAPAMPAALLKLAARADRLLRGKSAKLTPDRARYMCHPDWVCRTERAVPAQLWQAQVDTEEGIRATAQWYRDREWL